MPYAQVTTNLRSPSFSTINLPAAPAGSLVLLFLCGHDTTAWTFPAGWTVLASNVIATPGLSNNYTAGALLARIMDGTEPATITVTGVNTVAPNVEAFTIEAGTFNGLPEVVSIGNLNPPSLTPSWGEDETLWVASLYGRINSITDPIGYGNRVASASGSDSAITVLRRERRVTTEDPGAFTQAAGDHRVVYTVAIRPANGSGPGARSFILF